MTTIDEVSEYPEPETVLAIRGAITTGRNGGPMGPPGSWLNEFWQIGAALRDHAEMLHGFQTTARHDVLSVTGDSWGVERPPIEQLASFA
ncbi:hypothetical protein [Cupriavidus pampae]|uniref:hypothetical protein n=1 Tax=Cupriavidus pampae TaxID=659251 RepID=UPI001CC7E06C|nr:hypothetical protein [Cupriavidus pampae]